ncbi:MAG: hypothetical protein IPP49_07935 [Saprospiraceae bacterium]|nr:hypothetical protein [Saprospiraceae bacterium]
MVGETPDLSYKYVSVVAGTWSPTMTKYISIWNQNYIFTLTANAQILTPNSHSFRQSNTDIYSDKSYLQVKLFTLPTHIIMVSVVAGLLLSIRTSASVTHLFLTQILPYFHVLCLSRCRSQSI